MGWGGYIISTVPLHCKHNRDGRTDGRTDLRNIVGWGGYIMSTVPSLPQVPRSALSNDGIYALIGKETYLQVSVYLFPFTPAGTRRQ